MGAKLRGWGKDEFGKCLAIRDKVGGRGRDRTGDPLLAKQRGETLKCFDGVAYTDNQQNSRSPNVPKLYRVGPGFGNRSGEYPGRKRIGQKWDCEATSTISMRTEFLAGIGHQPHNGDLYFSSRSWTRVIQLQKTNFTFKTLRYPLHRQFLALFRAVEKIKVD